MRSLSGLLTAQPLTLPYYSDASLQRWVNDLLANYPVKHILVFSSAMAQYVRQADEVRRVIDFVDIDSDKWKQYADKSVSPASLIFQMESRLLLKYEKKINSHFDHSVFVSRPEADLFLKLYPGARNVKTISNGVDHNYFSPDCYNVPFDTVHRAPCTSNPIILFTGAMDYHANIDGVAWFCS